MPRIQGVERKKGRSSSVVLVIEGGERHEIPDVVAARWPLSTGAILSSEEVSGLLAEAARQRAIEAALRLLTVRSRSRAELERGLRRRGHSSGDISAAADRCAELGYLDDRAFAEAFVRDRLRHKPRGVSRLRSELRVKGISAEIADEAIQAVLAQEGTSERELLERLARRRRRALRGLEPGVAERRLASYLLRRGFPPEEVRRVVGATPRR